MHEACRCAQCWSLAEYMRQLTGNDYGLTPAFGHAPLRVVHSCDGTYTCTCSNCSEERKRRVDGVDEYRTRRFQRAA